MDVNYKTLIILIIAVVLIFAVGYTIYNRGSSQSQEASQSLTDSFEEVPYNPSYEEIYTPQNDPSLM